MSDPIRIGVLGLSHDHVWDNLNDLESNTAGQLIAVADPNQPLLDKASESHSCNTYLDYQAMLDTEQLDAVYIFGDNATGATLGIQAAQRGLHVLVEKPLAATREEAQSLVDAATAANRVLMVNWPIAWWKSVQTALAMAEAGDIGDVWQVKYRAAHEGPRELGCSTFFCDWLYNDKLNGGGAIIDYCCYGAALAAMLIGMPERVMGTRARLIKDDIDVDDNAVIVMMYPHASAIAEASWTTVGHLTSYFTHIYGTKGTLLAEPGDAGRLRLATTEDPDGSEIECNDQADHMKNATNHFIHCIRTGDPITRLCQASVALDAQTILSAGIQAADSGTTVALAS